LKEIITQSSQEEKLLLVDNYKNNMLAFSTITNFKFLSQVGTILYDKILKLS